MKQWFLHQEPSSFSLEGPGSTYFRLHRSWASGATAHFCCYRMKVITGNTWCVMSGLGRVSGTLFLRKSVRAWVVLNSETLLLKNKPSNHKILFFFILNRWTLYQWLPKQMPFLKLNYRSLRSSSWVNWSAMVFRYTNSQQMMKLLLRSMLQWM